MAFDSLRVEVELGEEQLGDGSFDLVVTALVGPLRVGEQVEREGEELAAGVELAGGIGQLSLDGAPLSGNGGHLGLQLVLRPVRISQQFQVAVFLGVQLLEADTQS